ncbi:peptidase inhibitor family I36 protein [Streptomyces sp. NPDC002643]
MKRIRRLGVVLAAASSLLGVGLATAPTASAAPSDCPRSYVCVWDNMAADGLPRWKSQGNLYNMYLASSGTVINNGVAWPGADHIYVNFTRQSDGRVFNICLHYPPDTNRLSIAAAGTINSATWGGECP